MKEKLLAFMAIAAIITLAFTFYTCMKSIDQTRDYLSSRDRIVEPEPQTTAQFAVQTSQQVQQSGIQPALRLTPRSAYQTVPEDWSYIAVDAYNIAVTGYSGTATTLEIPLEIEGLLVTRIQSRAFINKTNLINVIIPNTVITIEQEAFAGCSNLISVTIGNSVNSIGAKAFANCVRLAGVTIPDRVNIIEWGAFLNCASLTNVTIGKSVNYIGAGVFENCNKLINVTFENTIASYSFSSESLFPGNLRAVYLSEGGGAGIYTRLNDAKSQVWWKQ